MQLSPEEKRRIYEEEKARIEKEEQPGQDDTETATGLKPNVAGLLCYAGVWITGIIFLILEQKNRFVRFHAVQSIIVFAVLMVGSAILGWFPDPVGSSLQGLAGVITFILWIVLMVQAYRGEWYKIPGAGDIAASIVQVEAEPKSSEPGGEKPAVEPMISAEFSARLSEKAKTIESGLDKFLSGTRAGRITGSSFAIAGAVIALIFFSFFSDYLAYYEKVTSGGVSVWQRTPFLTANYFDWLPTLITYLLLSIAGHILLIIYDRYWLRETVLILLGAVGLVTTVSLLVIFPFDFHVFPSATVGDMNTVIARIVLIVIAFGMGVGALARFIRLIVNIIRAGIEKTVVE